MDIKYDVKYIKDKLSLLPMQPGCYLMKDKDGTPIKRNGKEIFVEGKHIVGEVYRNFEPQFAEMTDEFGDDLLKGGKVLL